VIDRAASGQFRSDFAFTEVVPPSDCHRSDFAISFSFRVFVRVLVLACSFLFSLSFSCSVLLPAATVVVAFSIVRAATEGIHDYN